LKNNFHNKRNSKLYTEIQMKYINVFLDNRVLWSASLCEGTNELDNIGGSYPNARSAELDGQGKWGREFSVKVSYTPMFIPTELKNKVIGFIREGAETESISERLGLSPSSIRAIKAHVTRGTYNKDIYDG